MFKTNKHNITCRNLLNQNEKEDNEYALSCDLNEMVDQILDDEVDIQRETLYEYLHYRFFKWYNYYFDNEKTCLK
uniref:Uncharacterized protein n=1 Tax=viral metagenome TaxID=1070528 RepID=A0A6C0CT12_9ZZZZ